MILKPFDKLPSQFQNDDVRYYYDILSTKRKSLILKRIADFVLALIMTLVLIVPMAVIAVIIKLSSTGPVFYKQERVTTYGEKFMILKFRTMKVGSDKSGLLTLENDDRITGIGKVLRKLRLDELPQIFHVLSGKMSIVGTRPEVQKYVDEYTPAMYATLLMPAGITSFASIEYKDEDKIIGEATSADMVDEIYISKILPDKMKYNLKYIEDFSFFYDIKLMFKTVMQVIF